MAAGAIFIMTVIVMAMTGAGAAGTIDTGDLTARAGMDRRAIVARKSGSTFRRRSSTIPAYPVPVPPPVVQLSSCQQTVGNGLIERYGPGSLVFSGGAFEGTVTLDRQPFNYRCAGGQVNIW